MLPRGLKNAATASPTPGAAPWVYSPHLIRGSFAMPALVREAAVAPWKNVITNQEHTACFHWPNEQLVPYEDLERAAEVRARPLGLQPVVLFGGN
jgi:hypothetical protein